MLLSDLKVGEALDHDVTVLCDGEKRHEHFGCGYSCDIEIGVPRTR